MGFVNAKENSKTYSWVFNYKDKDSKWKQKTVTTGVPVTGKRKDIKEAERIGMQKEAEERKKLELIGSNNQNRLSHSDDTIEDYCKYWLGKMKGSVKPNTFKSYEDNVTKHIIPLLGHIKLKDLTQFDLSDFIDKEIEQCKRMQAEIDERKKKNPDAKIQTYERPFYNSIKKHVDQISMILGYAESDGDVSENVAKKINKQQLKKIPKSKFLSNPYTYDEILKLREAVKGTQLEAPVMLASYLGLRREEVLGLTWKNVDFEKNFIYIRDTVVLEGTKIVFREHETKTSKSRRPIPMVKGLKTFLLGLKEQQEQDRKDFGRDYIKNDFVCKRPNGDPLKPGWLSEAYSRMLKQNGLRHTRFHDLRHSVATIIAIETNNYNAANVIGDRQDTTSQIYVNRTAENLRSAMEKLDTNITVTE